MKRTLITMMLWVVSITLTAYGTNRLSITGGEGHPGDEVTVSVSLENSDAVVVAELQIPLDEQLEYVDGSCLLNADRTDGHQVTAGVKNGALNIIVYTMDLNPLKGSSGELLTFKLRLRKEPKTYTLNATAVLGDAVGCSMEVSVAHGEVTILSPKLNVLTAEIDYGHIPIRSTYTQDAVLYNAGNETLVINAVNFTTGEFSVSENTFTIGAGESRNVTIYYAPINRGAVSEKVTFVSNSVYGEKDVVLKAAPFSVNELHVGSASGISDSEVSISLTMNNMESIVAVQCEFTLPEQLVYVEGSFTASTRADKLSVSSSVSGNKLSLMLYSLTGTEIEGTDGEIATFKVKLNGTSGWYGLNPENVILSNAAAENMTSATSGGNVNITSPALSCSESLDMGECAITAMSTAVYTISNHGNVPLTINKVTFLAEGYSVEETLPLSIEPWQSKDITVKYSPTMKGEYTTVMQIYSNDPQNRMKSVIVSGSIYEPNNLSASGEVTTDGYTLTMSLDNYTEIAALQMDVRWLSGMTTSQDLFLLGDRLKGLSYVVSPMDDGVYRLIIYSMSNTLIASGSGELFTLQFVNDGSVDFNNSEIVIEGIVLSDSRGVNAASQTSLTKSVSYYLLGDVTCDDKVNVMDVMSLSNYILGKIPSKFDERAGDATGDGKLNVMDVMSVSKIIMSGTVTKITINE